MNEYLPLPLEMEEDSQREACYAGLPVEVILSLEQRAITIITLAHRASFEIGAELVAAREAYRHNKHGGFETWVEKKLNFSRRTAYNLIERYEAFATVQDIAHLAIVLTAQYRLSAPSVPQEAREEAIRRAEGGEKITEKLAKEIIEAQRAQKRAEDAERHARMEAEHTQQRLIEVEAQARQEMASLTQRITELQGEMATLKQPEGSIREVDPPAGHCPIGTAPGPGPNTHQPTE